MKYSAGQLPHELLSTSIELYGTKVIPLVRDMLADQPGATDELRSVTV